MKKTVVDFWAKIDRQKLENDSEWQHINLQIEKINDICGIKKNKYWVDDIIATNQLVPKVKRDLMCKRKRLLKRLIQIEDSYKPRITIENLVQRVMKNRNANETAKI